MLSDQSNDSYLIHISLFLPGGPDYVLDPFLQEQSPAEHLPAGCQPGILCFLGLAVPRTPFILNCLHLSVR